MKFGQFCDWYNNYRLFMEVGFSETKINKYKSIKLTNMLNDFVDFVVMQMSSKLNFK